jgi:integrase
MSRITKEFVKALVPEAKPTFHWDDQVAGFGVKHNPTGSVQFIAQYRPKGVRQTRRITIGSYPTLMPEEARKRARAILGQAAEGKDYAEDVRLKARKSDAERRLRSDVAEVLAQYREIVESSSEIGERHRKESLRYLELLEDQLGGMMLSEIDGRTIRMAVTKLGAKPPSIRYFLAVASRFFAWTTANGLTSTNPVAGIERPRPSRPKERVLSLDEVAAIWKACDRLGMPHRNFIRFTLMTGARREEAARMTWSEIDLAEGIWSLPSLRSKNRNAHRVFLNDLALETLRELPLGQPSQLVFPTGNMGSPISGFSWLVRTVSKASGVEDWALHDFRRTLVSRLAEHGVSLQVADRLLNHAASKSAGGVLGIYQKFDLWPERVRALELWSRLVASALGMSTSNVLEIRRA